MPGSRPGPGSSLTARLRLAVAVGVTAAGGALVIAVATATGAAAAAVGANAPQMATQLIAERWNGHGWHAVSMTATGGHLGELSAVHCLTATNCVALAQTTPIAATARSESAFWNGTRWKVVATA